MTKKASSGREETVKQSIMGLKEPKTQIKRRVKYLRTTTMGAPQKKRSIDSLPTSLPGVDTAKVGTNNQVPKDVTVTNNPSHTAAFPVTSPTSYSSPQRSLVQTKGNLDSAQNATDELDADREDDEEEGDEGDVDGEDVDEQDGEKDNPEDEDVGDHQEILTTSNPSVIFSQASSKNGQEDDGPVFVSSGLRRPTFGTGLAQLPSSSSPPSLPKSFSESDSNNTSDAQGSPTDDDDSSYADIANLDADEDENTDESNMTGNEPTDALDQSTDNEEVGETEND